MNLNPKYKLHLVSGSIITQLVFSSSPLYADATSSTAGESPGESPDSVKQQGIGIEINYSDHKIMVANTIGDSPAAQVGIKPGDEIIAIDQKPVFGLPLNTVVPGIRGPQNSVVLVSVLRDGSVFNYKVTRGYTISPFGTKEIKQELVKAEEAGDADKQIVSLLNLAVYSRLEPTSQPKQSYSDQAMLLAEKTIPANSPKWIKIYGVLLPIYLREYSWKKSSDQMHINMHHMKGAASQPEAPAILTKIQKAYNHLLALTAEPSKVPPGAAKVLVELRHDFELASHPVRDYTQSITLIRRGIAIGEANGVSKLELAKYYQQLGWSLSRSYDQEGAIKAEEHSLLLTEQAPDHTDVDLDQALSSLVQVYESVREYNKAIPIRKRILELSNKTKQDITNSQMLSRAWNLSALARDYEQVGNYAESLACYERAFKEESKTNTSDWIIAEHQAILGDLYVKLGQYKQAEPALTAALSRLTGSKLARVQLNLAIAADKLGKKAEATDYCLKVLQTYTKEKFRSSDYYEDTDTTKCLSEAAILAAKLGDKQDADYMFSVCLSSYKRALNKANQSNYYTKEQLNSPQVRYYRDSPWKQVADIMTDYVNIASKSASKTDFKKLEAQIATIRKANYNAEVLNKELLPNLYTGNAE